MIPENLNEETDGGLPTTPCSASFTPGPWRYQKETTRELGSSAPPRVRYEVYKEEGIYGHPASCDREEDARLIAASPDLLALAENLAAWDKRWPKWSDTNGTSEKELNAICQYAHEVIEQASGQNVRCGGTAAQDS